MPIPIDRYRKLFSREYSLIRLEFGSRAEYEGISAITNGNFFYKPLYVSENGLVSVYYNFHDMRQSVPEMLPYLSKNIAAFRKHVAKTEESCNAIIALIESNSQDIQNIFTLILDVQPVSAITDPCGIYQDKASDELFALCEAFRKKYDKVIYRAEDHIMEVLRTTLPKKYYSSVKFLTLEEVTSGNFPAATEIERRKKEFIYFSSALYHANLEDFAKEKNLIIETIQESKSVDISGTSAYPGKVTGTAQVLASSKEINQFKQGNILITPMTTPTFMPIIPKASAIITDEGGLTCHAAIVSRELKIPCIVGTKNASKRIKTGDKLEVNATSGKIKIL